MKNRNLILCLIVLIASVGAALATSRRVPQPTWIHGFKLVAPNTCVETCSTLGLKCEPTGTRNCEILANVNGINVSTIGYGNNICTIPLKLPEDASALDDTKATIYCSVDPYTP